MAALANAPLERKKEVRALSAFALRWDTFAVLNSETKDPREAVVDRFHSLLVFRWADDILKRPGQDYADSPRALVTDFVRLCDCWESQAPYPFTRKDILYAFLARNLSFELFRLCASPLRALDDELNSKFSLQVDELCDELFPTRPVNARVWNKFNWLRTKLELIKRHTELLDAFTNATIESAPIRKVQEFGKAFLLIRKYFIDRCPPSEELGEDELLPAAIGSVVVINPPALVSNLAFLTLFCMPPEVAPMFENQIAQPMSVLRILCKHLRDPQALINMGCNLEGSLAPSPV
jgi:hypothetical protein